MIQLCYCLVRNGFKRIHDHPFEKAVHFLSEMFFEGKKKRKIRFSEISLSWDCRPLGALLHTEFQSNHCYKANMFKDRAATAVWCHFMGCYTVFIRISQFVKRGENHFIVVDVSISVLFGMKYSRGSSYRIVTKLALRTWNCGLGYTSPPFYAHLGWDGDSHRWVSTRDGWCDDRSIE